jgi:hypothetical protein
MKRLILCLLAMSVLPAFAAPAASPQTIRQIN